MWVSAGKPNELEDELRLLVALSMFRYQKNNRHPFHNTLATSSAAFDKYPVENLHSSARTKETSTGEQTSLKAKEIDACKHELPSFKSWFVPPKKFNFSSKKINNLKVKAVKFVTTKFQKVISIEALKQTPHCRHASSHQRY